MVNCRFTVAIHVLCLLAAQHPQPLTSEVIAGSVNTNPVVIRRILGVLRKAGLVKSQPGVSGGWELVAKPESITLGGLYQIIRPGAVFAMHSQQPNVLCPVGRNIQRGLGVHYQKAQAAMEAELERTSIADVLREVLGGKKGVLLV
jgi:Rrf2 family protein